MDQNRTFLFKLSLELGVSIRYLETSMSYNEFLEYQKFYLTNPFHVDRQEIQMATLIDILLKVNGNKESNAIDYMISITEEQKEKAKQKQKEEDIIRKLDEF